MRFVGILLFGMVGVAILLSLGVWQVKRLAWKEAVLSDILIFLGQGEAPRQAARTRTDTKMVDAWPRGYNCKADFASWP